MSPVKPNFPVPEARLEQVTKEACEKVFKGVSEYTHGSVEDWNQEIINNIITELNDEASSATPPCKLAVTATTIQQSKAGKRGMYTSVGAFWNADTDGIWSYKFHAADELGMDVIVKIIWMAY